MEKLKKNRSVIRAAITKLINAVENEQDGQKLEANYMILEKKGNMLDDLDRDIYNLMLEHDEGENDLLLEVETAEEYSRKINEAKIVATKILKATKDNDVDSIKSRYFSRACI